VVQRLRQLGHDVVIAQESGQGNQGIEDAAVLAFASAQGRAILTFNRRHSIRPLRWSGSGQSVVPTSHAPRVPLGRPVRPSRVRASASDRPGSLTRDRLGPSP
jgi:hypothetical protein